jgi:thioredoxin 1
VGSIEITTANFQVEVLESPVPVLLDFWAPWCGPCKMIGPVIDKIADEYSGQLKVGKINIDDNSYIAEQHGIVSIPTLVLYKNGEVKLQKTGAGSKHDIEAMFKNQL